MLKKKRLFALLAVITILFVMLSSIVYVAAEADHDCIGEHCPICQQIAICENTLKQLSAAVTLTAIAAVMTYISILFITELISDRESLTLITLKVKLSN